MKIIFILTILLLCVYSNFTVKLQSRNFADKLLDNYAIFAESLYTPNSK